MKHLGKQGISWCIVDNDPTKINVLVGRIGKLNKEELNLSLAELRKDNPVLGKKLERLNRIALEAAKQSGRGIIPRVSELLSFDQAASELGKCDFPLICYEGGGINLSQAGLKENSSIGVFIGSEGGFDPREVEICTQNGAATVGLGKRILRCETAPITAISIIMNLTGNI